MQRHPLVEWVRFVSSVASVLRLALACYAVVRWALWGGSHMQFNVLATFSLVVLIPRLTCTVPFDLIEKGTSIKFQNRLLYVHVWHV